MIELSIDPRGEIAIENLEWLMENFPGNAQRALASALKSEGYRLSQLLKLSIRSQMGGDWPALNPHTGVLARRFGTGDRMRDIKNFRWVWKGPKGAKVRVKQYRTSEGLRRPMLSTRSAPQSRMSNVIGYNYDPDTLSVDVSFNGSAKGIGNRITRLRHLMHLQAEGKTTTITPRMRKMLFALGFPVGKDTHELVMPKRESVQPLFNHEKDAIIRNIDQKFEAALRRYVLGGAKS